MKFHNTKDRCFFEHRSFDYLYFLFFGLWCGCGLAFPLMLLGFLSILDRLSIRRNAEKSSEEIFSRGICNLSQNSWISISTSLPCWTACSNCSLTSSSVGCGSAVVLSFRCASRMSRTMLSRLSCRTWLKKSLSCICPSSSVLI